MNTKEHLSCRSKIAIHQPNFAPSLIYFSKYVNADIFVLYDDTFFSKNSFTNRNKVSTGNGSLWLTVPVCYKYRTPINVIELNNWSHFRGKMIKTLSQLYKHKELFNNVMVGLEKAWRDDFKFLVDLNVSTLKYVLDYLDLPDKIIKSSEISYDRSGDATDKIISIVKSLPGSHYIAGSCHQDYIDLRKWNDSGIVVEGIAGDKKYYDYSILHYLFTFDKEYVKEWIM